MLHDGTSREQFYAMIYRFRKLTTHDQDKYLAAVRDFLHDLNLGQLVWGASGNLGDAKKSKLILQVSQLVLELLLALALKFANLQFCCTAIREVRWKKEEKWSIHKYIHIFFWGEDS